MQAAYLAEALLLDLFAGHGWSKEIATQRGALFADFYTPISQEGQEAHEAELHNCS